MQAIHASFALKYLTIKYLTTQEKLNGQKGGGSRKTLIVEASDPKRAKQLAETIANAEAKARKSIATPTIVQHADSQVVTATTDIYDLLLEWKRKADHVALFSGSRSSMPSCPIVTCVQSLRTDMPAWLEKPKEQLGFSVDNLRSFLDSRSLFYGGAGFDGSPLRLFNKSHAVHCHLHADYDFIGGFTSPDQVSWSIIPQTESLDETWQPAFRGYWPICNELIRPDQFLRTVNALYKPQDGASNASSYDSAFRRTVSQVTTRQAFLEDFAEDNHYWWSFDWPGPKLAGGVWAILERDPRFDDSHGPARFAFLHMTAEAFWIYWFIYGRYCIAPFALVLQDHGFGGNFSDFGGSKSVLLALTQLTGLPPWILRERYTRPWPGYTTLPGSTRPRQGGGGCRVLEKRTSGTF